MPRVARGAARGVGPLVATKTGASLEDAADLNLATHFTWVQRQAPGMRVRMDDALVLTDCGLACDTFNAVCRARLAAEDVAGRVRDALAWFAAFDHPFSWWVGPGDTPAALGGVLEEAGLERAETELAMAADLSRFDRAALDPGPLDVRRVGSRAELAAFAAINAANWTPPDQSVLRFYDLGADILLAPDSPLRLYIGWLDGVAVAASELTIGGGVAGLYNISTREAHRRRGFGSTMTLAPLVDAAREGHRKAILQAAPGGVGVYRRIGFEPFGEITEFKPPAAASGS